MAITPYYASLIDPDDENCPIRSRPSREDTKLKLNSGKL